MDKRYSVRACVEYWPYWAIVLTAKGEESEGTAIGRYLLLEEASAEVDFRNTLLDVEKKNAKR